MELEKSESLVGRRTFLDYIIGFVISAWGLLTVYVSMAYLWPSKKAIGNGSGKSVTIPLSDIPEGKSRKIRYEGKPAIIVRTAQGVFALSAVCPHLGCLVNWYEDDNMIECPCHDAKFDIRGNVIGGPSPKPLESFKAEIKGEIIKIG